MAVDLISVANELPSSLSLNWDPIGKALFRLHWKARVVLQVPALKDYKDKCDETEASVSLCDTIQRDCPGEWQALLSEARGLFPMKTKSFVMPWRC